jgi:hypothetical protein
VSQERRYCTIEPPCFGGAMSVWRTGIFLWDGDHSVLPLTRQKYIEVCRAYYCSTDRMYLLPEGTIFTEVFL